MFWDKMFDHNHDNKLDWMEEAEKAYVLNEIIFGNDEDEQDDDSYDEDSDFDDD